MTPRTKDPRFYVQISRVDEEERTVEGYATTETLDSYGTVIDLDSVRACLPDFCKFPALRAMHQPIAAGTVECSTIDDTGLYIQAKVVDDDAWKKVKAGVYRGLSLGGKKDYEIDGRIFLKSITEISLVDRPSNPDCVVDEFRLFGDSVAVIKRLHSTGGQSVGHFFGRR